MKRLLPRKLERFQNLISSVDNSTLTDYLREEQSLIDIIEDDYLEFISFLKEYQKHHEFTESEKPPFVYLSSDT